MECHAVRTSSLLLPGWFVLCSAVSTGPLAGAVSPTTLSTHGDAASLLPAFECGGEPCDAVLRGLRAFLDRTPDGLVGNGRACADCHVPTVSFQLSPAIAEARFQL